MFVASSSQDALSQQVQANLSVGRHPCIFSLNSLGIYQGSSAWLSNPETLDFTKAYSHARTLTLTGVLGMSVRDFPENKDSLCSYRIAIFTVPCAKSDQNILGLCRLQHVSSSLLNRLSA